MNVPQQQRMVALNNNPSSTTQVAPTYGNSIGKPSTSPAATARPHIAPTSTNTIDLTDEDDPTRRGIIQNGTNPPALVAIPPQSKSGQKVTYVMQQRGQPNNTRIALQKVGNQYSKYIPTHFKISK